MKRLFLKEEYLNMILERKKDLELRVGYDNIRKLSSGDFVMLQDNYKAEIKGIRVYSSVREAMEQEDFKRIVPDVEEKEEAIKKAEAIYPAWKQKKLGVYILELKTVKE